MDAQHLDFMATSTNLTGLATWVKSFNQAASRGGRFSKVRVSAFASHAGAYVIEQSTDGVNWITTTASVTVSATTLATTEASIFMPYVRVTYTNGATPTTSIQVCVTALAI